MKLRLEKQRCEKYRNFFYQPSPTEQTLKRRAFHLLNIFSLHFPELIMYKT